MLQSVSEKLDQLLNKPVAPEATVPDEIIPNELLFQWEHQPGDKLRVQCPIPKVAEEFSLLDFADFKKWLKLNTNQREEQTRTTTVSNLKRFFWLLNLNPGCEAAGVLVRVYRQNLLPQMRDAPMMHTRYSWARSINQSLDHYINYLITVCNRNKWNETKSFLQQLADECLHGMVKEGTHHRQKAQLQKKKRDSQRLTGFPDTSVIQTQVKMAMGKIKVIYDYAVKEGLLQDIPQKLRLESITNLIGIVFYNAFPGRPGEWTIMLRCASTCIADA